jgi:predicted peroxiredoxin
LRNTEEDIPIIFECTKEQIAHNQNEINENTKAYIGKWNPEISKKIPENVLCLYESFPDKKIFKKTIELSVKSSEEYTKELTEQGFKIYSYAQDMLNKLESLKQKEKIDLVLFSVEQLGFPKGATLQQIYDKAKEFGLELCPPQVGPELRLNYKDQPMDEYLVIAMNSIDDRDGYPKLFYVNHYSDGEWLDSYRGDLGFEWRGGNRFVFRLRKD